MSKALHRRVLRLESAALASIPAKRWLVLMPGQPVPDPLPVEFGGVVQVQIREGRKPYPIFEGERLAPDAWPHLLTVPTAGLRPAGEPMPDLFERIPGYVPRPSISGLSHDHKSGDPSR